MPLFNVQGTQNLFEAADLLEKAVARDPNYFQAYCKLASVHDQIYLNGPDQTPARLALADAALKAAQRLRPDAGETHLALAEHLYCGFLDYDRARHELELARRSLPNEPLVFELAGFIDRRQGHWDASTRNFLRALELIRAIPIRCNSSRSVIITCAITRTKQRFWTVHWRSCLTTPACGCSGLEFPCIDALTRSRSTPRSTQSWPKTRRLPRDSPTNGIILRFASAMRLAWIAPWLPCPPPATAMPAYIRSAMSAAPAAVGLPQAASKPQLRSPALAVDPVQVLQQQHRRPRRDHLLATVPRTASIIHTPPQQRVRDRASADRQSGWSRTEQSARPAKDRHARDAGFFARAGLIFGLRCFRPAAHFGGASSAMHRGTACSSGLPSASRTCQSFCHVTS